MAWSSCGREKDEQPKRQFIKAIDILDAAERSSKEVNEATTPEITLGAVKYSLLKSGLGSDLIYDARESVSIEGNSGPYLQYALTRAKSILAKGGEVPSSTDVGELTPAERTLARKISMYPEVFALALQELSPHYICTYLYELAQTFNRFYESNRVIGDERSGVRMAMLASYAEVLTSGLGLLGIKVPEKM